MHTPHHRNLGSSSRAAHVRRQRLRLDRRRAHVVFHPRRVRRPRPELHRHRRRLLRLDRGPRRAASRRRSSASGSRRAASATRSCSRPRSACWARARGCRRRTSRRRVNDSLRRLKTDYIDVYFSHIDDAATPLDETLGAYQKLVKAGKVRVIGASNYTGERVAGPLAVSKEAACRAYQVLRPGTATFTTARATKPTSSRSRRRMLAVVRISAWRAVSGAANTARRRTRSRRRRLTRGEIHERPGLPDHRCARRRGQTQRHDPATVALAWIIARPSVTAPIASATSVAQLESLAAATRLALPPETSAALDEASARRNNESHQIVEGLAGALRSGNIAPEPRFLPDGAAFSGGARRPKVRHFTCFSRMRMPFSAVNPNSSFSGLRGRFARVRRVGRTIEVPARNTGPQVRLDAVTTYV